PPRRRYLRDHRTHGLRLRAARQPPDPRALRAAALHHAQAERLSAHDLFRHRELSRTRGEVRDRDGGRRPFDLRDRFADAGGAEETRARPDRSARAWRRRQGERARRHCEDAAEGLIGYSKALGVIPGPRAARSPESIPPCLSEPNREYGFRTAASRLPE